MPAYIVLTCEHTHDNEEMKRYSEKAEPPAKATIHSRSPFMVILKY